MYSDIQLYFSDHGKFCGGAFSLVVKLQDFIMALNADTLKLTNANDIFHRLVPPTGVTLPSSIAIDQSVGNAHTGRMIPTITLQTLHFLLLVIWHSANTEDRHSCNVFSDMVRFVP